MTAPGFDDSLTADLTVDFTVRFTEDPATFLAAAEEHLALDPVLTTVVSSVTHRALEDVERGVVDTDKGPVLDHVYDKVREGAADPVKKFSP